MTYFCPSTYDYPSWKTTEKSHPINRNTPVTPQSIIHCLFSCWLQGSHFNTSIRGPWGSLGWRIVWVSAWGNAVIQTMDLICFRLICWFWNKTSIIWHEDISTLDLQEIWYHAYPWTHTCKTAINQRVISNASEDDVLHFKLIYCTYIYYTNLHVEV